MSIMHDIILISEHHAYYLVSRGEKYDLMIYVVCRLDD